VLDNSSARALITGVPRSSELLDGLADQMGRIYQPTADDQATLTPTKSIRNIRTRADSSTLVAALTDVTDGEPPKLPLGAQLLAVGTTTARAIRNHPPQS
jgi:hypothetical protein